MFFCCFKQLFRLFLISALRKFIYKAVILINNLAKTFFLKVVITVLSKSIARFQNQEGQVYSVTRAWEILQSQDGCLIRIRNYSPYSYRSYTTDSLTKLYRQVFHQVVNIISTSALRSLRDSIPEIHSVRPWLGWFLPARAGDPERSGRRLCRT